MKPLFLLLICVFSVALFTPSCKKEATAFRSSSDSIAHFDLLKGDSSAFKTGEALVSMAGGDTILISVPAFTDVSSLIPIVVITGKSISPVSGVRTNFTSPVVFTVTAEDGSTQQYTVVVSPRGVVYFGASDRNFYALDAVLGQSLWTTTGGGDFSYSDPILVNGVIYAGSIDRSMYAMDAVTGAIKWQYQTSNTIESPPAVADGKVFFGNDGHDFYALDTATGQVVWQAYAYGNISSRPVVSNGVVYFGADDGVVYALNDANGSLIWKYQAGSIFNASSPVLGNGMLYIGCRDGYLYALNISDGSLQWKSSVDNISLEMSRPTLVNGVVYIGGWYNTNDFSQAGSLYAIDAASGSLLWTALNGSGIGSDPVVADGLLYVTCDDNYIHAVDVNTHAEVWRNQILANGASAAVSGGVVYCGGGGNHHFYAMDAKTGTVQWTFAFASNTITGTSTPIVLGRTSL